MNCSSELNTTIANGPYSKWNEANWILPEAINSLLLVSTAWIIFSLTHYGIKQRKWRKAPMRNADKLSGGIVYTAALACAVMTLFRLITSQVTFNVGFESDEDKVCEMVSDASFAMYCLLTLSIYTFLWTRQRVFYANRMLHIKSNAILKVVSAGSLVMIYLAGLCFIVVNCYPTEFGSSREGCVYMPKNQNKVVIISGVVIILTSQLILVGLFVYPLKYGINEKPTVSYIEKLKGRPKKGENAEKSQTRDSVTNTGVNTDRMSRSEGLNCSSNNNKRPQLSKRCSKTIHRILKRTIAFALIAVLSDLILLIITFSVIPNCGHRRVLTVCFDVNSFLNITFVVGSFLSYKKMLLSPLLHLTREHDVTT